MITMTVMNQAQWDMQLKVFPEAAIIKVRAYEIEISEVPYNATVEICSGTKATLRGKSKVKLRGKSKAKLYDKASATLLSTTRAELYDNSSAELYGSSKAILHDNSKVTLHSGKAIAELLSDDAKVIKYGECDSVTLREIL